METGFAQPVFGRCVVVELTVVGTLGFLSVKAFQSVVVSEVDLVVVIDRDSTRADCLVSITSVVKMRYGCSEAVGPSQDYFPAFRFFKTLKSLRLFFEESFQRDLGSRCKQYVNKVCLGVSRPD